MLFSFHTLMMQRHSNKSARIRKQYMTKAKQKSHKLIRRFTTNSALSASYIREKLKNKRNQVLFYSIMPSTQYKQEESGDTILSNPLLTIENDESYSYSNIIATIIYRIIMQTKTKLRVVIHLYSILEHARGYGYGKMIMDDLIEYFITTYCKDTEVNRTTTLEIQVLSLKESTSFYKKYGFVETESRYILRNETMDEEIMLQYTHTF